MRAYTSGNSPVRKRQRLSSPTYDQQLGDLTQADIEAFDQIEACLSQSTERWPHVHSSSQNHLTANFKSSRLIHDDTSSARANVAELTYDPENPFTSALNVPSVFATASALLIPQTTMAVGFSKASAIQVKQKETSEDFERSPSPEAPPDQDYDSWFKPANEISTVSFQTASSSLSAFTGFSYNGDLGMEEAYKCLLERGCSLATQEWVNNHWCLILWKLAGMVGLEPERETIPAQKRWSWDEVMKQLLYRYERELHQGKRPPLRLITTRDASAAYPMVLCISDIFSPSSHETEIEVTDGWYRLRAQIDAPMVRAVRRGHIRIGRKIALAGAYLFSEKKDASEVLEAYNSMKLVISGNSSHLAPWHAKLGFSPRPFIATFRSLTSDGGMVAAMDIVVVKIHPIAYLEFIQGEDGTSTHQPPRKEDAEAAAHEKWKQNRDREFSKLYAQYEKKWDRYEGHIARLERRSGSVILTSSQEEFPLDVLENLYDELEDPVRAPNVIAGLGTATCRQLAEFIRHRLNREKTNAIEEIEHELQQICPPRFVKNFRIVVIQDARVRKHAGNRTAQLTVWDVRNLSFSEGGSPGSFEIGQRFLVTNLKPTQPTYWMGHEPGSEVYLCTGQHSRWTQIKSV
ncbi:hypothetical protein H0H93_004920 [Arthromyces matolae]|nr:hypothetical protein H0H93_004920 [Arthromyces matolae]